MKGQRSVGSQKSGRGGVMKVGEIGLRRSGPG